MTPKKQAQLSSDSLEIKVIMKRSIKIEFLVVLLLPLITMALLYASSEYFSSIINNFPANETYQAINDIQDIDKLRELSNITLESLKNNNKIFIEVHHSYLTGLVALIILNTVFIASIYGYYKKEYF